MQTLAAAAATVLTAYVAQNYFDEKPAAIDLNDVGGVAGNCNLSRSLRRRIGYITERL